MESYGLVLGGGGARGAYEIGVWKALKELDIPVKAVVGTSVGALNAAMIAQGDFNTAYQSWVNLYSEDVIAQAQEGNTKDKEPKKKYVEVLNLARQAVLSGGLDVTPLKDMLSNLVDEEKIRKSDVDLGIVSFSITDMKPVRLFKEDIPEGKLVDYLIASASFPAFKPQEIDNKKFIDGGVTDNVPISLMLEKGIRNIVAVDVEGPGLTRKVDEKEINLIYIKPSLKLGAILDFNGDKAKENIELGYYDAMKAFGHLDGHKYYISKDNEGVNINKKILYKLTPKDFKSMYDYLGLDITSKSTASSRMILQSITGTLMQYAGKKLSISNVITAMAEVTADALKIEPSKVYSFDELVREIMEEYSSIMESNNYQSAQKDIAKAILGKGKFEISNIEERFLISYAADMDTSDADEKVKRFRRFIAMVLPRVCIANLFIALMNSKYRC